MMRGWMMAWVDIREWTLFEWNDVGWWVWWGWCMSSYTWDLFKWLRPLWVIFRWFDLFEWLSKGHYRWRGHWGVSRVWCDLFEWIDLFDWFMSNYTWELSLMVESGCDLLRVSETLFDWSKGIYRWDHVWDWLRPVWVISRVSIGEMMWEWMRPVWVISRVSIGERSLWWLRVFRDLFECLTKGIYRWEVLCEWW